MEITKTLIDKAIAVCGSEAELSRRLEVTRALVNRWTHGTAMPTALSVAKMAEMTGINLDQALLGRMLDELNETEKGRGFVERWKRGFLAGVAAIGLTFNANATTTTIDLVSTSSQHFIHRIK